MYKQTLAILLASATLVACGSRPENPVDYVTYRDEPLVKQVEKGMTMQKVIAIGGSPSNVIDLPHGGTCNDYILNHDGHQQPREQQVVLALRRGGPAAALGGGFGAGTEQGGDRHGTLSGLHGCEAAGVRLHGGRWPL